MLDQTGFTYNIMLLLVLSFGLCVRWNLLLQSILCQKTLSLQVYAPFM